MSMLLGAWPWYVSGPLLGLMVPLLLLLGSAFGVSGNLDTLCCLAGAGKLSDHFRFDVQHRIPSLLFLLGSMIGGYIAMNWLTVESFTIDLSKDAMTAMKALGITDFSGLQPAELMNWNFLSTPQGIILFGAGGFLVGFGARYAGGCTSGHSISGMSNLQPVSLTATIGFFIGGLISTHFLIPIILGS